MTYSSFRCLPCTYLILIVRHHLDLLPGWHDIVLAIHRGGADRHVITEATSTEAGVGTPTPMQERKYSQCTFSSLARQVFHPSVPGVSAHFFPDLEIAHGHPSERDLLHSYVSNGSKGER